MPPSRAQDKEGLHARTEQIEFGGQKLTLSIYAPGRDWIHKAVDEILDSDDAATIAALESNVHTFLEKIEKEKELKARVTEVEQHIKRIEGSNKNLEDLLLAQQAEFQKLREALEKAVRTPEDREERRTAYIELTKLLETIQAAVPEEKNG